MGTLQGLAMAGGGRRGTTAGGWALRVAGGWSIALGAVIVLVAVAAMSTTGVAVDPGAGLVVVVGGLGLVAGGVAVWRGSAAAAAAMAVAYAVLLVWRQFTPAADVVDPNTGADIPVTPTMLLAGGLAAHVVALAVARARHARRSQ